MGIFTNRKYIDIYDKMEDGKFYTAKELGTAPASMTAMINRGLVEATDTAPRQYTRTKSVLVPILKTVEANPTEFFTLYKTNRKLGMLCWIEKEKVLDCWGNPYDLDDVYKMSIGQKEFQIVQKIAK